MDRRVKSSIMSKDIDRDRDRHRAGDTLALLNDAPRLLDYVPNSSTRSLPAAFFATADAGQAR